MNVSNRVPVLVYLAPLAPTFLLLLAFVLVEMDAGVPDPSGAAVLYAWLFTTVPLALLALGVRALSQRLRGEDLERDMQVASTAVTWAEGLVERARLTLEEADALLERRIRERLAHEAEEGDGSRNGGGDGGGNKAAAGAPPPASPARRGLGRGAVAAVVVLVALAGAAGWALNAPPAPEDVHLHAAFAVYVDGARVNFTDPYFDLSRSGFLRAHLHAPDQDILHVEGPPGLTLEDALRLSLRAELDASALRLDDEVHGGLTVRSNATHALRLFVAPDGGGTWTPVPHMPEYVLRDRDRLLLTYGPVDGEGLEAQFASVARTFPEA